MFLLCWLAFLVALAAYWSFHHWMYDRGINILDPRLCGDDPVVIDTPQLRHRLDRFLTPQWKRWLDLSWRDLPHTFSPAVRAEWDAELAAKRAGESRRDENFDYYMEGFE